MEVLQKGQKISFFKVGITKVIIIMIIGFTIIVMFYT